MPNDAKRVGRKLLVATLGMASVNFGACSSKTSASNTDAALDGAQIDSASARTDAGVDGSMDAKIVGSTDSRIVAPPDAADASDARQFIGNIA